MDKEYSGIITDADVSNIKINCNVAFTIGGTITGLEAKTGVGLSNNSSVENFRKNGPFTFSKPVGMGKPYDVIVARQPEHPYQTCMLYGTSSGSASSNITNVMVNCGTKKYSIGGTVRGLLSGSSLTLKNDKDNELLTIGMNGPFTFGTPIASGQPYDVLVSSHPLSPPQICSVANGKSMVLKVNVTKILVDCKAKLKIEVKVTGLAATSTGLVLQNIFKVSPNKKIIERLSMNKDGSFYFPTDIISGDSYDVTIFSNPSSPWQTCSIVSNNGKGIAANANIIINVDCVTRSYTIGGTVIGLAGAGLVLQNKGGDDLSLTPKPQVKPVKFTFQTPVASGDPYGVTVFKQPSSPRQLCTVAQGGGTVANKNIINIQVTCINVYTISVDFSGLKGSGLELRNNGGDSIFPTANGRFTFPTPLPSGSGYNVAIPIQPSSPWQTCSIVSNNGKGNVTNADIIVKVVCVTNSYTIGGTITGLAGTGLILRNNGGDSISPSANGSFTFPTPIESGTDYTVTVFRQPSSPDQTCTVTNITGTVVNTNVTNIVVSCVNDPPHATALSAGGTHTCALLQDSTINCWGSNNNGQLGNGTTVSTATPVLVSRITTAIAVSAGGTHTCALLQNRTINCWGSNNIGQLGNGTRTSTTTPVLVAGITTGNPATAVSARGGNTCALLQNRTINCWGGNADGQLGNRTTVSTIIPVPVSGITTATAVATGGRHACAVLQNGMINCWGHNIGGELGDGTIFDSSIPVFVSGMTTATAVATDFYHTCALLQDSTINCWGHNADGQIGNGTITYGYANPISVSGITIATAVATGESHTCVLLQDSTINCWGSNNNGQLGNGTMTNSATPVVVLGIP